MSRSEKEGAAVSLPKRFYREVAHEPGPEGEGWIVLLDGRPLRTPLKAPLRLPSAGLAQAVAREWDAQRERIDPNLMPLTRLANTALDRVRGREGEVADEIARFAESDLLCYRAQSPAGLAAAQSAQWDPILEWYATEHAVRFTLAEGVMHVEQPEESVAFIREDLHRRDAFALSALHTITTLTGSVLLALAHARGRLDADAVWNAAHVDENWQISQWGEDREAAERRNFLRSEMMAA
ncbi:MAG: ATPase, partial [Alphaproteobacteria bacterium]